LKVNLALQRSPCIFEYLEIGPCLQPLAPPPALPAPVTPPPLPAVSRAPAAQAPLLSTPRALQLPCPPLARPPLASPCPSTSRRRRPSCHACRRLVSSCFTCAVLLLALKLAQESLSISFTHSTTQHCFSFLPPLDHPRRSSAAASARRHQPPSPPHTRKPVLLRHHCNPLKLTEQSNSIPHAHTARTTAPVSSSSAATRSRRRPDAPAPLSPCQAHR
jgi:hypothetical protein